MKNLKITVNGTSYDVQVEELNGSAAPAVQTAAPAQVAAPAAPAPAAPAGGEAISAPMPGTIVSVNVTAGQSVKSGEVVAVLEAMKMENEIVAPKDGTVSAIHVSKGESVDSGAPLITLN